MDGLRPLRRTLAMVVTVGLPWFCLGVSSAGAAAPSSFSGPVAAHPDFSRGSTPRMHRSPAIAVDPGDERHLVVTDLPAHGGPCAASTSLDGGASWQEAVVHMPAGYPDCVAHGSGPMHPVFATGTVLFAAEVRAGNGPAAEVATLASGDGGRSYNPAGVVAAVADSGSQAAFQPSLAAAPGAHAPVYAAFGCGGVHPGGAAEQLCMSVSHDAGATWGPLGALACQLCAPDAGQGDFVSWPRLALTGKGTLVVTWTGYNRLAAARPPTPGLNVPSPPSTGPLPGAAGCGSSCVLYAAGFPANATSPASTVDVAAVGDDPLAAPTIAGDPRNDHLYLLWHGIGPDQNGAPVEAIWMARSEDGAATWHSRTLRDKVLPLITGDGSGDAVFPDVSIADNGRVDLAFLRMARSPRATDRYCYTLTSADGATCPTQAFYAQSAGDFEFGVVATVSRHSFDSLAGVGSALADVVGEHGAAVAGGPKGAHPTWVEPGGPANRDVFTDCFAYGEGLCARPPAAPALPAAAVSLPITSLVAHQTTVVVLYHHTYHLEGPLEVHLPDLPAPQARVVVQVVPPDKPPLALVLATLAASVLILGYGTWLGGHWARQTVARRRAGDGR